MRIITKAGHESWPRLFQNLRASCETDWVDKYPAHAVAKWLGHSPKVATEHYLMSREHHFKDVVGGGEGSHGGAGQGSPGGSDAIATRFATPQAAAPDSTQPHETTEPAATIQVAAGSSKMTPISGIGLVGNTGFERTAILPSETAEAESECAHLCATSEIPAFVAASGRLAAWDELPSHLRGRLTSLDPDVLTALHALFCGIPR